MKAFALPTFGDARIRLNVRGRERDGIVEPADYDAACRSWTRSALAAIRGPAARSSPPRGDRAPARRWSGAGATRTSWSSGGAASTPLSTRAGLIGPFPFRRTSGHSDRGFAFFSGPGISAGNLGEWRAMNLTATLVALLSRAAPPRRRPIAGLCAALR